MHFNRIFVNLDVQIRDDANVNSKQDRCYLWGQIESTKYNNTTLASVIHLTADASITLYTTVILRQITSV